jgi:hypothetical protein
VKSGIAGNYAWKLRLEITPGNYAWKLRPEIMSGSKLEESWN